nr:PREDICTED: dopamine beta-hydroxylase [Anolis carolinensis]|eukprot:XP_016854532.1 PREDICTED: dopamine beta-hydroxylase [Anolis carolinensis]
MPSFPKSDKTKDGHVSVPFAFGRTQSMGRRPTRPSCPAFRLREVAAMYLSSLAVFLLILVVALQGTDPREDYFPYKVPLDPQSTLELSWNVSYLHREVHFQILVKKLQDGLLFGMSDRGGFEDADLAVLWSDGVQSYFADAWSDHDGHLHMDSQQNYKLLKAWSALEGFYLLFKRSFDTCDPKDYRIEDGTVHLIYGILEAPVPSLGAINVSALRRKGLQRVQLLKPDIRIPSLPSDLKTMVIRAPNVSIPGQETTYWCYMTELPDGFGKHHIVMVGIDQIPTERQDGREGRHRYRQGYLQGKENIELVLPHFKMEENSSEWESHIFASGFGLEGWQSDLFPRNIFSVFPGHHDSSGIRLFYTASLRPYDAGIMELGLVYTPVMAIPPGESHFGLTGYCTETCTQVALPPSGIHIFASQLHTHLTGRSVETVLSRGGQEKEIVNKDPHYSPHFQEIRMLKKVVSVFPGDVLRTTCIYNTEDRSQATVGGFGIMEEMCVNYVHYYPQTELELCKSAIDLGYLQRYFKLVNRFNDEEVCTCPEASVTQQFASVPWNSLSRDVLKSLYGFAPISMHCNKSSAVRFPGEWERQTLPKVTEVLPEPASPCEHNGPHFPASPTIVKLDKEASK